MNPRVDRYNLPVDDNKLDALFELRATPITLGSNSPIADGDLFENAATNIFVLDSQIRAVLRRLAEAARLHAEIHLGSDRSYIAGLHRTKDNPWGVDFARAIGLSGLAGVGKSQLLKAMERLFGTCVQASVSGIRNLVHRGVWSLSIRDGTAWDALVSKHVVQPENGDLVSTHSGKPSKLQPASKSSWREAACVITVDEFQFMSHGADTNAKATSLLLRLQAIGPRLVYCINFDMASRLLKRPKADKDRLIAESIVLLPWTAPCDGLAAFLKELKKLCPEVFVFDPEKSQRLIIDYTFGIRRNIVQLLRCAYVASRRKGARGLVTEEELAFAYASVEYAVAREDVVLLVGQSVAQQCARVDLWNPWDEPGRRGESVTMVAPAQPNSLASNVIEATTAKKEFERRVNDAYITDALTPAEANAVKKINPEVALAVASAKVILLKRKRSTDSDLLAGDQALDEPDQL